MLKKWRSGQVLPMPDNWQSLKDRATQLLINRSGTLVMPCTQCKFLNLRDCQVGSIWTNDLFHRVCYIYLSPKQSAYLHFMLHWLLSNVYVHAKALQQYPRQQVGTNMLRKIYFEIWVLFHMFIQHFSIIRTHIVYLCFSCCLITCPFWCRKRLHVIQEN